MGQVRQNLENCKNCTSKCTYSCSQLQHTIQYNTEQCW